MAYGAYEYAYAKPIADALELDPDFRAWVLEQTKFDATPAPKLMHEEMKAKRSKSARDWWRSHYTEKCRCEGCRGHETDLLAIFELHNARRVAVHFEVKHPNDVFHPGQGRAYALRADCWVRQPPNSIVPHDDATTVLLCSGRKLGNYGHEADQFEAVITFEQIRHSFPQVLPASNA